MYAILLRYLPAAVANTVMVLWYSACLLAILWYWDIDAQAFRYLEL